MDTINTGGTAFPVVAENGLGHVSYGMDLRDYFAAKAMSALIVANDVDEDQSTAEYIEETALGAYKYADAMLRARGA